MPVITDIRQSRNKRFSVYVDGAFCFSASVDIIAKYSLHKDYQVKTDKLEEIQQESLYKDLFSYALKLLSFQNRTSAEIAKKLEKRTSSHVLIESILDKLKGYNYIDPDEKFMEKGLESKTGYGYFYFLQKFTLKGIKKEVVKSKLDFFFKGQKEMDYAEICLEKQHKKLEKLEKYEKKKKMASILKGHGFSNDVIYEKIGELSI